MKQLEPSERDLLRIVHEACQAKLAREPKAIDVTEVTAMTDVVYVCHGDSERAVDAIVDAILAALKEHGRPAEHVEGRGPSRWVLVDLGAIMVHVFLKERRDYYGLENMWHDGRVIELEPDP